MEGEETQSRCKVYQIITKIKIENLKFQKSVSYCHSWWWKFLHFFLYFFESKHTAIDPSFTLTHQPVNRLYRIDLCVCIWHENNVFFVLVNTHTQNSVFGQVNVLIVKHLFLGIRIDFTDVLPDELRQENSHADIPHWECIGHHFVCS